MENKQLVGAIALKGESDNVIIDYVLNMMSRTKHKSCEKGELTGWIPRERKDVIYAKLKKYNLVTEFENSARVGRFIKLTEHADIILGDYGSYSKYAPYEGLSGFMNGETFETLTNLAKTSNLLQKKQDLKNYQFSVKSIEKDIENLNIHYNKQIELSGRGIYVDLGFTMRSINEKQKLLISCKQAVELLETQIQVAIKSEPKVVEKVIEKHFHYEKPLQVIEKTVIENNHYGDNISGKNIQIGNDNHINQEQPNTSILEKVSWVASIVGLFNPFK